MAKRRGQREGSIFKRRDGRWCAALTLGWKNGKRHRKWLYGGTRQDVQQQLTTALRNHQLGLNVAPERQTAAQFLERWLTDCVAPSTRPRTLDSYSDTVRLHLIPTIGKVPLGKLAPQHVQAMMNAKLADFSPRSVQYMHSVLSRALNRAVKWDLVARNVCTLVSPPRVPRRLVEPLSPDDARRLLEVVKDDQNEALYSVAMALGLRKGEALGLRWQDVDLESATLSVRHQLQNRRGKRLTEPKSDRSRRTLPLPEFAVKALRSHRARQLEARLLAGSRWQETGHVFTTSIGTPMDASRVSKQFRRALAKAGLPHKRFHDLRHTAASLLLAQGVHPRVVMEILGHSQISVTMNTYSHVMPTLLRDAADKMDAILAVGE
ncbi:MAG: site-specific integrase [Candidatus Binatia bacterium]|jgi:integrase